ncbi:recombinase family protein [Brevibacillus borstelensis]|uniref:recombinase family protein n=1 Tax=Brevibacillus borstelensis TaxID=45462 RepID=UPI0030F95A6F
MKLGYARVSSKDQNEERQVKKLLELGIEERFLFIDKQSGKDFNRPRYQAMRDMIREGDVIYIDALDRLGRDYDGIIREWKWITREMNADIVVLEKEDLFDSRKFKSMGDMGKLMEDQFLALLAFVAEQERKKIKQRQAEGIAIAKENGKHLGRPKVTLDALSKEQRKQFDALYPKWKDGEVTAVQFMNELGLKKTTFYKIVKEYEQIA